MGKKLWFVLIFVLIAALVIGGYLFYAEMTREKTEKIPQTIGNYVLNSVESEKEGCINASETADIRDTGLKGEICLDSTRYQYTAGNSTIHVITVKVSKGFDLVQRFNQLTSKFIILESYGVFKTEAHEISWYPEKVYQMIGTQEYTLDKTAQGTGYGFVNATGNNAVTHYFLNKYPPAV